MKQLNNIVLAAASLLLPLGCTKEPVDGGGGIPMQVAPSLDGGTRASLTSANLTEFYLQMDCTDAAFDYFGKLTKSGSGWDAGKQLSWKNETTPVSYSAAFFGSHAFTASEFASGVNLSIPANQSTQAALNSADLLTVPASDIKYEDTAGGILPVNLHHGLAKVNFVLTLGSAFYDANLGRTTNPVTVFTVKGANTGFNFKPLTGVVTVTGGTQADITPLTGAYTPSTASSKSATATYEAILLPQSFAAGELRVSFSVDECNYTWSNTSAITLSAGTTFNLLISTTTGPPVDPYNGHANVDMGNGLKWATCNVGAENPWNYGDYIAWGETATKSSYNYSTYRWMEFGRSSLYYITKYTFADGETEARWYNGGTFIGDHWDGVEHRDYASYDYADDAARQRLGGTWRTPTAAEWTWLRENCSWSWTTLNGVNGMIVTSNANGNQIFLPAAGYLYETDLIDCGIYGYYWSSSLYETKSYFATSVYFKNGEIVQAWDQRIFGQHIRPVAN